MVPETAWLIERRLGPLAEARFLRLVTTRRIEVVDLSLDDYARCVRLIEEYADLGLVSWMPRWSVLLNGSGSSGSPR